MIITDIEHKPLSVVSCTFRVIAETQAEKKAIQTLYRQLPLIGKVGKISLENLYELTVSNMFEDNCRQNRYNAIKLIKEIL